MPNNKRGPFKETIKAACLASLIIASTILTLKGLEVEIWIGGDRFGDFSIKKWEDASQETKAGHGYPGTYALNNFSEERGMLKNSKTHQAFKPSGKKICEYRVDPSGQLLYVYSFSGYHRDRGGYVFLPDMRVWGSKIGVHYVEIFDLEREQRIFSNKTLSFAESYKPKSVF